MEETKLLLRNQLTQFKCTVHPNIPCDFISLDDETTERTLCFNCAKNHSIPSSKLISISSILQAAEDTVFYEYPPLNDNDLSAELKSISLHQELEQIDSFFQKLRENFEKAIRDSQSKAKAFYIQQDKANQNILEEYKRIAEIQKLKDIVFSKEATTGNDLDTFVKDKVNKAEQHRAILQNLLDSQSNRFEQSFQEPNIIAEEIIKTIQDINFFTNKKSFQSRLVRSTIGTSEQLEITKLNRSGYEIKKNEVPLTFWDTVFVDPILNPQRKYIFEIELDMHPENNHNQFFFGIVEDKLRGQPAEPLKQEMCYYDYSNSYGLTKIIKGKRMQSGSRKTGKHSFEMRIHINQRFLRVASLPEYESIVEIDDVNKINPKGDYRVFVSLYDQWDIVRIKKMEVVNCFDEKM